MAMYATPRRAFTTPARLSDDVKNGTHQALNLEAERNRIHGNETTTDDEMQQTLFQYAAGKVVKLNLNLNAPLAGGGSGGGIGTSPASPSSAGAGTIPWTSARESLMAVGPLRFYRTAATNIAFLTCGRSASPFLLSIFPKKTQCWCVDGETKFVILVGTNNYYRIELLDERKEEVAADLKSVLPNLLQYETTVCPFTRNFSVEIPEVPSTPIRKKPWKPREPQTAIEILPGTQRKEMKKTPETSTGSPSHDDGQEEIMLAAESSDEYVSAVETGSVSGSSISSEPSPSGFTPRAPRILLYDDDEHDHNTDLLATPTKPISISSRRSVTAPLRLKLDNLPQSNLRHAHHHAQASQSSASSTNNSEGLLPSSSADSFFSFHSPISPIPPSTVHTTPPSPGLTGSNILIPKIRHSRDISDITITSDFLRETSNTPPSTALTSDAELNSPAESKRSSILDGGEWAGLMTPPPSTRRARIRRRASERDFSPMPSAANLISGPPDGVHLGALVLQKTCSIMLGPSHIFLSFMLGMAAKIATGAIHGVAYPFNKDGGQTTTAADWGYCSEDEGIAVEECTEDDYGISLYTKPRRKGTPSNDWSLD